MENDYRNTYSKVCCVKEVEDLKECNKLLKQHWILLNTYTYCVDPFRKF